MKIKNVPELIQYLRPPLKELDVSGNLVGHLNRTTLEQFLALESLKLSNTNVALSESNPFEKLQNLRHLEISLNRLNNKNYSEFQSIAETEYCSLPNKEHSKIAATADITIKELGVFGVALEQCTIVHLEC